VSHESIYRTLFVHPGGALRKELTRFRRAGPVIRQPQGVGFPTLAEAGRTRCTSPNARSLTQADFDAIAQEPNERPRQTLGFKTPSQALAEVLR
jgi:IS30 family transposase